MVALAAQQPKSHDDHNLPLDCVLCGDCLDVLRKLPADSIDSVVVDPPYGLGEVKDIAGLLTAWIQDEDDKPFTGKKGFMGKEWDAGVPGPRYWREVLRVLKPGAHILCFSGTRTVDLMTIALRLSGFQIKDTISWLYGAGFPKSLDISKQIDKLKGAEREVIGYKLHARDGDVSHQAWTKQDTMQNTVGNWGYARDEHKMELTAPATDAAKRYNGYGTALKPAHEPIILARKPLSEKSIAENVLKWNCGALNIDACRIEGSAGNGHWTHKREIGDGNIYHGGGREEIDFGRNNPAGKRFPSNLLLSHSVFCVPQGTKRVRGDGHKGQPIKHHGSDFWQNGADEAITLRYTDPDGYEEVEDYLCDESCPILQIDLQTKGTRTEKPSASGKGGWRNQYVGGTTPAYLDGPSYHDTGGASRYFSCFSPDIDVPFLYCSKSSRTERNRGCEGLPERAYGLHDDDSYRQPGERKANHTSPLPASNHHPTVKPVSLVSWLCTLITPPGGIILDPFAGSGTTGVCAVKNGFHFILVEQSAEYAAICEARIAHAVQEVR